MFKILAFSGSNSSTSINYEFLQFIQSSYSLSEIEIVSLKSLEIPMFSVDIEKESGIPATIVEISKKIQSASKIMIATPEHNGTMTAYLKSSIDWISRHNKELLKEKKVFILGTSPGRGGALGSIEQLKKLLTRLGAEIVAEFSLPSYNHSFENGKLITDKSLELDAFVSKLIS